MKLVVPTLTRMSLPPRAQVTELESGGICNRSLWLIPLVTSLPVSDSERTLHARAC